MSDLKGLARSFDTLFSAPDAVEEEKVAESDASLEAAEPEQPVEPEQPAEPEEPSEPVFADLDDVGSREGDGALSGVAAGLAADALAGEESVFEAMDDIGSNGNDAAEAEAPAEDVVPVDDGSAAAEPEPDLADELEPDPFDFESATTDEEPVGEAPLPVEEEDLEVPEPSVVADVTVDEVDVLEPPVVVDPTTEDGEFVPTPLDRATAEFVAGDASRASDIESLAATCVERRELDPVARAVASITLAAGDPVDASIYSVAETIMSPPVLARLASHIGRERHEERRAEYYTVCRTIGVDMAEAIRADLAENTDRLARRIHCQALVEMGEPGRVVIEEMAVDENRFLVRNAVSILGDQGGERAVELCTSALANPDARVRKEALRSLAKLGDPESGPIVVGLLDDPDTEVRLAAAVAAGELRVERALKSLIAMLEATKDPDEALLLIRALGRIADPGAVSSIEKHAVTSLFSKPRTDVRITSYRALNEIGTPHARRLLNQAVDDKDPAVKSAVKEMLGMR